MGKRIKIENDILNNEISLLNLKTIFYDGREVFDGVRFKIFEFEDFIWCYVSAFKINSKYENQPKYLRGLFQILNEPEIFKVNEVFGPYCKECYSGIIWTSNHKKLICPKKHIKKKAKMDYDIRKGVRAVIDTEGDITESVIEKLNYQRAKT